MTDPRTAGLRPLLVTADPDLLDDLLRLTAGAGVEADVAAHPRAARPVWQSASSVLVGRDQAATLAALGLPRRTGVLLVGASVDEQDARLWRDAVDLGVDKVVLLPEGERGLVEMLAATERSDARGTVVAVVGGRGGAGASVLAAALCVAAVRSGRRPLLVDADPWGGGADLLLGAEDVSGLRWPDLVGLAGTVSGTVLGDALPSAGGVSVVSWDRGAPMELPASAAVSVLDAGVRSHDLVVVDLPRRADEIASAVLSRASRTLLVVPAEIRAAAAAAQALAWLLPGPGAQLVVRTGRGRSVDPDLLAAALGVPLAAVLADETRLAAEVESGDPPGARPRSALARTSDALLAQVFGDRRGAAA